LSQAIALVPGLHLAIVVRLPILGWSNPILLQVSGIGFPEPREYTTLFEDSKTFPETFAHVNKTFRNLLARLTYNIHAACIVKCRNNLFVS
jgi:hypothetical protein